ncbi:uncharacterized protein BO72DRAFT_474218 [Aspergillus fijiensis CBS 313.89]|uniref:Uncharacterized protein n=1 Tax=Aspergillus fijiensis CBS 313.89 TaxID=1448319 RepID=A0A8G1S009_9EURO|nr:uncharacterized protein BO72DRAFT_474218 [Aspergillus fijiensis CBS 313.89]RAK81989.1 hypothetical protein BO72DRAFT_474218 [Aspergillus fijiensis CBS 313.89]
MPYSARTESLPDAVISGGLVDPRAEEQPSFSTRMSCRDATDFMSNIKRSSPMISRHKPGGKSNPGQPLSDLVPGLVISGGRSRSPAFDGLPVVSHWGDRTGEASAADPAATVCLTSTWFTSHVLGEGSTMQCPLGAPCWSLKTHGIGPVEAGSSVLTAAANISWGRNTRVADAVDCALELLADAAVLLAARNKVISTGVTERLPFAAVHAAPMPTWCVARKPLPPKLSGVALSLDPATTEVLAAENCVGPLLNTSIFSMAVGYNRGVYGGSISGLWAIMDSAFVLDYSIGKNSPAMAEKLAGAFADVAATAEAAVSAGPHITDIRVVKGCNYACLHQKTIIEDTATVVSRPCMVVWDDLARLARYKLADAVFCHVYYDSGGGEQMAAMAGLGCVVYSRLVGAMIWYHDHDPYNPAALCILFTHWWQLANCRHRPITLLGRTDLSVEAMAIAATIPTARPSLEHFRACGTPVERGEGAFAAAEARFNALLASNPLAQTRRVADLLVRPVLAYVRGTDDHLPLENEYVGAVLAAEIAYPQDQKIRELWDLAIVMWECGALWAAGVAGLCYTHSGQSNCDRAREDLSDCTWS